MTGALKGVKTDIETRESVMEDGVRDCSDVSMSKEHQGLVKQVTFFLKPNFIETEKVHWNETEEFVSNERPQETIRKNN